jgi:hypothetical protein
MEILWFYIAVALAVSDELHTLLFWKVFFDFYILLAGLLKRILGSNIRMWVVHELLETVFHFIFLSLVFLSPQIGVLAAGIHLFTDLLQEAMNLELPPLIHRAYHFVMESFLLILYFAVFGV